MCTGKRSNHSFLHQLIGSSFICYEIWNIGLVSNTLIFFQVGDHIEKIDGKSVVGCRHFEVAKMLKGIPKGTTFVLRVVEPLKAGFGKK